MPALANSKIYLTTRGLFLFFSLVFFLVVAASATGVWWTLQINALSTRMAFLLVGIYPDLVNCAKSDRGAP